MGFLGFSLFLGVIPVSLCIQFLCAFLLSDGSNYQCICPFGASITRVATFAFFPYDHLIVYISFAWKETHCICTWIGHVKGGCSYQVFVILQVFRQDICSRQCPIFGKFPYKRFVKCGWCQGRFEDCWSVFLDILVRFDLQPGTYFCRLVSSQIFTSTLLWSACLFQSPHTVPSCSVTNV